MKSVAKTDKKDWKDITLEQFEKIQEALENYEDPLELISIIFKLEAENIPITELNGYLTQLEFLKKEIPTVSLKKTYTLNGRVYNSNCDLTKITTGQFIDYTNYLKANGKYNQFLSVFFIPEGCEYNTGYDMLQVQEDLKQLPIIIVKSACDFFTRQLTVFLSLFQHYLEKDIKSLKMDKTEKRQLLNQMKELDLANLALFPIYLNTVKSQMKQYQQP